MEETKTVDAALAQLGFKYKHEAIEEGVEHYEITVDEEENLVVSGILYKTEEGAYIRLLVYVDELSEEQPYEQLALLMTLNGDIPTGAYCLDHEEDSILVTVNVPVQEITVELLGWVVEFMFVAQEVYYEEYYPADAEDMAQG
jgi:hypothetical protein